MTKMMRVDMRKKKGRSIDLKILKKDITNGEGMLEFVMIALRQST